MPDASAGPLAGRRALVTGAASGIGLAVAVRLAADGCHVLATDLPGPALDALAETLPDSTRLAANLASADEVRDLARRAGGVDILVNNAGLQRVHPLEEFPDEDWDRMLAVMLTAPFLLTKHLLGGMYDRSWGRIVNISSVHGLRASPFKSAYVAAKHALEGLSKVIALEGGPRGVTSNTICPAYVRTPLVENQIADQARVHGLPPDRVVTDIMLTEPAIKRLIEPAEVAELAAYLCRPEASFASGSSWVLDGGWTAR
ncbi:MAG TPA: 3-hydroxybutyrate dehydrogenase [Jatrophihabitans sp.]|nr:3-hydroxybutyrate dehydrogenase [Jatrophihabitans sp.]